MKNYRWNYGCMIIIGALFLTGLVSLLRNDTTTQSSSNTTNTVSPAEIITSTDGVSVFNSDNYKLYTKRNEYLLTQIALKSKNSISHESLMNIALKIKELYYVEKGLTYSCQDVLEQIYKAMPDGNLVDPQEIGALLLAAQ